ncbi:UNKNOWN [Stylonychia lemnae]|uniref:Transmembrane protein n=1 Tax=Stylonychia lemnae TaxID=5949 RepID=A0A077ZY61_STYLE|nr:UNKNOWN [Stylonychia lemnae]|eukprot:CDW74167.1 UNKNOWN [Stylonychia lemnae]
MQFSKTQDLISRWGDLYIQKILDRYQQQIQTSPSIKVLVAHFYRVSEQILQFKSPAQNLIKIKNLQFLVRFGGVIAVINSSFQDIDSTYRNSVANYGGVMYMKDIYSLTLNNISMEYNVASDSGSVIYIDQIKDDIKLSNITIRHSQATFNGAIYYTSQYQNEIEPRYFNFYMKDVTIESTKSQLKCFLYFDNINGVLISERLYMNYTSVITDSSIYIQNAVMVELHDNQLYNPIGRQESSFLYIRNLQQSAYLSNTNIDCFSYGGPDSYDERLVQQVILDDFQQIYEDSRLISSLILINFGQLQLNNFTVQNCDIRGQQQQIIVANLEKNTIIIHNSTFTNIIAKGFYYGIDQQLYLANVEIIDVYNLINSLFQLFDSILSLSNVTLRAIQGKYGGLFDITREDMLRPTEFIIKKSIFQDIIIDHEYSFFIAIRGFDFMYLDEIPQTKLLLKTHILEIFKQQRDRLNFYIAQCQRSNDGQFIHLVNTGFDDYQSTFQNNFASQGGVFSCNNCTIKMENSIFKNNVANQGGCIFTDNTVQVILINITIINNKALRDGGFIYLRLNNKQSDAESIFILKDSNKLSNNQAERGGFIYSVNPSASITLQNITVSSAYSTQNGGFISLQSGLKLLIQNSNFDSFKSAHGALIYSIADTITINIANSIFICDNLETFKNKSFQLTDRNYLSDSDTQFYVSNAKQLQSSQNSFQYCGTSSLGGVFTLTKTKFSDFKSKFLYNSGQYGGVINSQESQSELIQSKFSSNQAKLGGAFYMVSYSNLTIINCQFSQNYASESGGVIFLSTQSILQIQGSEFTKNVASDNSVIDVLGANLNYDIKIEKSIFEFNYSTRNTLSFVYANIFISDSQFKNNIARERTKGILCGARSKGGAIYASNFKSIYIGNNTILKDNFAIDSGEDIYLTNSVNTLTLNKVQISNVNAKNSIYIDNLRSAYGGAIYIIDSDLNKGNTDIEKNRKYYIVNSVFNNCSAQVGGAIMTENAQSILVMDSQFIWNKAINIKEQQTQVSSSGSGGAIYYTCDNNILNCKLTFYGINMFKSNDALIQGGAIYWNSLEPIYNNSNLNFINNSAKYGDNMACYAQNLGSLSKYQYKEQMIKLGLYTLDDFDFRMLEQSNSEKIMFNQTFDNQRSGGSIPIIYMALIDKYGQIVGSDFQNQKASMYPPILEGSSDFSIYGGIAVIDNVQITGNPGSNYQISFSTDGIDLTKLSNKESLQKLSSSDLNFLLDLKLRECQIGEQFTSVGKCQECDDSYSLKQMKEPGSCEICPSEKAVCLGGANIGPLPGYWRQSNMTKNIEKCLFQKACLGMIAPNYNPIGDCLRGYRGILCADCEKGFSRDNDYQCTQCPEHWANSLRLLAILVAVVILIVFMYLYEDSTQSFLTITYDFFI